LISLGRMEPGLLRAFSSSDVSLNQGLGISSVKFRLLNGNIIRKVRIVLTLI
jgi:hypothetical protein